MENSHIDRQISPKERRRAVISSVVGASIEYFDYLLYGTLASLVFNKLFFPGYDPAIGVILALATFGITYFFRPLGGIIFSHIGDKVGRKKTLIYTLGLMGLSTMLMGLLPTYETIGIWAPILLITLRLLQAIAIGGEYGGATLLAVEYYPENQRGFAGSFSMTGAPIGLLLGTATVAILTSTLSSAQFLLWGWRIPFVLSILLVIVGLWIRSGLRETPAFERMKADGKIQKMPFVTTMKYHWRAVLLAAVAKAVETGPFYLFGTLVIAYTANTLNMREDISLTAISIGALCGVVAIPLWGMLGDRIGIKRCYQIGTISILLLAFPYYYLLSTTIVSLVYIAIIVSWILWACVGALMGSLFSNMFDAHIRYTGVSLGYQTGAAVFGGTAPMIATTLLAVFNNSWIPVALFLAFLAIISLISTFMIKEEKPDSVPSFNKGSMESMKEPI